MTMLDLDGLWQHIRSADYTRGTPEQVALWREDLDESRANLAIEGLDLNAEDEALFAMMLEEGLSPATMVEIIRSQYHPAHCNDAVADDNSLIVAFDLAVNTRA